MSKVIHFPTPEEEEAAMNEFFDRQKLVQEQWPAAAIAGQQALERLVKVLCERSGQPYKVRALLYSLWNGKPAQLIDVVNLDWEIRQDLVAVIAGFGYESNGVSLFYRALEDAVKAVGQWEWFLEERFEYKVLEEYVWSCKEAQRERRPSFNVEHPCHVGMHAFKDGVCADCGVVDPEEPEP